ncbi:MAG: DUF2235 domain-containing protein [Chloroflexota bacterium]
MKRLVICCDGTWNQWNRERPTNVVKMARAILPAASGSTPGERTPQIVFYDEGVGTGDFIDRARGGLFGYGLDKNIEDAYRFLVNNYEDGDEIFLFGFSRGAYTARSANGLIRKCGLLEKPNGNRIGQALELYRRKDRTPDCDDVKAFRRQYSHSNLYSGPDDKYAHVVDVQLIGVWDTVGSMGIPLRSLRWVPWNNKYKFHDQRLSGNVKCAYHAVSIDERRGTFAPTLWTEVPPAGQIVEQVWFAGVHSEVGGGSKETGLSELALGWMIDKAKQCGLAFDESQVRQINAAANPSERVDRSLSGIWRFLLPYTRRLGRTKPGLPGAPNSEFLHPSVCVKFNTESPSYRPENLVEYLKRDDRRFASVGPAHWNEPPANQCP